MKRSLLIFSALLVLASTLYAETAPSVRILPRRWGLKATGNGRVKAEIRGVETDSFSAAVITMNGVAAIRTQITPKKVIAFFPKKDVLSTLGTLQKGQNVTLTVAFTAGNAASSLTDTIRIAGKGKSNENKSNGKKPTKTKPTHPQ